MRTIKTAVWAAVAGILAAGAEARVVITDFVPADGTNDVAEAIQNVIDAHPNETIYFPDGVYLLGKPILTPASPKTSVALRLDNYATLKAAGTWPGGALVRLGAKDPANDIYTPGSNYGLEGGILDGSGVADGVSIDGGRETTVRNVSIKRVRVGLHIKRGANSGSSDCDISGVNITGNKAADSVGVLVEGYDNTFTNMRIANVRTGVELRSGGNCLRNIHPLYTCGWAVYAGSTGFKDSAGQDNWYNFCYSDQFQIAFRTKDNARHIYDNCFTFWYSDERDEHVAFQSDGRFNSIVKSYTVGFRAGAKTRNTVLKVGKDGGQGVFTGLNAVRARVSDLDACHAYLRDPMFR